MVGGSTSTQSSSQPAPRPISDGQTVLGDDDLATVLARLKGKKTKSGVSGAVGGVAGGSLVGGSLVGGGAGGGAATRFAV